MIKLNASLFKLENAKLDLEDAKSEFANQQKLLAKGFTSSEKFQNAKLGLKKAQSDYKEAAENHQLVKEDTQATVELEFQKAKLAYNKTQEELTAASNNLNLIKDGVSEENAELANTLIRSTTDGMVLDVAVKEGNLVIESSTSNVGTTVATVADMHDMIFEGSIDESEVGKIKEGMELILSIGAIENETFQAAIEYIAPKGKKVSGAIQFDIRAKLILKKSIFVRAGYSANADIVLEKRAKVLAIEERWLQFDKDKPYVEVETESQVFEKRPIEVGISDGLKIEVLSGITQSDRIKIPE
jgi:HlyD family secretion protein